MSTGIRGETVRDAETAYHEAGHVVAYVEQVLTFRYATLQPRTTDAQGRVHLGKVHVGRPRRGEPSELAIVSAAGMAAERLHVHGVTSTQDAAERQEAEFGLLTTTRAQLVIDELVFCEWPAGSEMLKADLPWRPLDVTVEETVLLLVERWDAVSAVAAALLASPRALTGRECVELVAAHPPVMMDGDWWRALTETRWAE